MPAHNGIPPCHRGQWALPLRTILAVALLLRLCAIDFGLPNLSTRPDETTIVRVAFRICSGDLNPHFFNYPTFFIYVTSVAFALYYKLGLVFGWYDGVSNLVAQYAVDPSTLYMIPRLLSLTAGVATCWLVYRLALHLCGQRRVALLAALCLACSYLHVRDSHYATTDAPLTFMITLTTLLSLRLASNPTWINYISAGAAAGIAMGTKYNGVMLALPILVGHLEARRRPDRQTPSPVTFCKLAAAMAAMAFAFLLSTPYVLLDWKEFLAHVQFERAHLNIAGQDGASRGFIHHFVFTLWYGLGWPYLCAAIVGVAWLLWDRRLKAVLVLSFPLAYYCIAGESYSVFTRYMVPMTPFLALTCAYSVSRVAVQVRNWFGPFAERGALVGLTGAVLCLSTARAVAFDWYMSYTDNRIVTRTWLEERLPATATVGVLGDAWVLPLFAAEEQYSAELEKLRAKGKPALIWSAQRTAVAEGKVRGFPMVYLDRHFVRFVDGLESERVCADPPEYLVTENYFLPGWCYMSEEVRSFVAQNYDLVQSFTALEGDGHGNVFDGQDRFYMPFAGFHGLMRPGPNLYVYRLKRSVASLDPVSVGFH